MCDFSPLKASHSVGIPLAYCEKVRRSQNNVKQLYNLSFVLQYEYIETINSQEILKMGSWI